MDSWTMCLLKSCLPNFTNTRGLNKNIYECKICYKCHGEFIKKFIILKKFFLNCHVKIKPVTATYKKLKYKTFKWSVDYNYYNKTLSLQTAIENLDVTWLMTTKQTYQVRVFLKAANTIKAELIRNRTLVRRDRRVNGCWGCSGLDWGFFSSSFVALISPSPTTGSFECIVNLKKLEK